MENIIHILSDSVANQIAAGEVIQRPASVVKELVENAIDAGATQIDVSLKDAGRTLIRVSDNGKGMSPEDANLAFVRHATSKIQTANDLFHLHTMGFRGEALASIASVAQVELVTRRSEDELAWKVEIEGSIVTNQEPTLSSQGSRFTIRNLFYNIPARRKFLGDNAKELKAIRDEFIQIALVYPSIQFSLTHNDEVLYNLSVTNLKQRVLSIFGKRNSGQLVKQLYPIDVSTQLVKIQGFVGDPSAACQRDFMQYFFVNGRFIKHKSFRSAILKAFDLLIPHGHQPAYFLYFEVDPEALDVNIHPTKTEVKFEHESAIWPIVHASIREALGKANAVPSIDFDRDDAPEIMVFSGDREVLTPSVKFDPGYNPFTNSAKSASRSITNWDSLLQGFENKSSDFVEKSTEKEYECFNTNLDGDPSHVESPTQWLGQSYDIPESVVDPGAPVFQLFNAYIVVRGSNALFIIDQHRAHVRLLYDKFSAYLSSGSAPSQMLLFPEVLDLDGIQRFCLLNIMDDLKSMGFVIICQGTDFTLTAVPSDSNEMNGVDLIFELMDSINTAGECPMEERRHKLALQMANATAIPRGQKLSNEEVLNIVNPLFELPSYKYTPDGKPILVQWTELDIQSKF